MFLTGFFFNNVSIIFQLVLLTISFFFIISSIVFKNA